MNSLLTIIFSLALTGFVRQVQASESVEEYVGDGQNRVAPAIITFPGLEAICLMNIWRRAQPLLTVVIPASGLACPDPKEVKVRYETRGQGKSVYAHSVFTPDKQYSNSVAPEVLGRAEEIDYKGEAWEFETLPRRATVPGKESFCIGVLATKEPSAESGKYKREFLACPAPPEEKDSCPDVKRCFDTRHELHEPRPSGDSKTAATHSK